jgi:hypothetical protein
VRQRLASVRGQERTLVARPQLSARGGRMDLCAAAARDPPQLQAMRQLLHVLFD